ncbi:hypothetical protein IDSA_07030 [Pseudidiomarina salinarum]|uniref:Uncharacterized protein n=1 Tax=Pseudidiomarina salinarum TaxID=435908 RepID=A0A094JE65_9GAMM|nr:hypothetical protein [Pseudidiomarina salinarum]KFZ30831.1 hypothetical protein IDSA_07030 [Pseudidiomarina salinarum]RUO71301.1 hypothetical protein CWI79_07715 [Pseudidiomarina salinarum]
MKQSLTEKMYLAFRFEFEHGGHIITAVASGMTGKEEVLVDGERVSGKRNFGLSGRHPFVLNGTEYEVRFDVGGFLLSQIDCTLSADGQVIETKTRSATVNKKTFIRNLIVFFLIGMGFGYLAATIALDFMG